MANILDYINWRGDLTMTQSPFNEVDNLILSELSYFDFGDAVPMKHSDNPITIKEAAEKIFCCRPEDKPIDMGVIMSDKVPELLKQMAQVPRFQDMKLMYYVDHVDNVEDEQFSALTIDTGDGHLYLAFRGTDDTLAGWKEDFEIACVPEVPAQKMAVKYINSIAKKHRFKRLRIGGHSKGGNLAVYGAVFCLPTIQKRISSVWSNDGPGFYDKILSMPEHKVLEDRIYTIVPKSSIVGMLLEHEEDFTVVDSDNLGIWQHDGFSWQVMGNSFITLPDISEQATESCIDVRRIVKKMSVEQRSRFVDGMFDVLTATGAKTLTDLKKENIRAVGPMLKAMKDLDKESRDYIMTFIQLLIANNSKIVLEDIHDQAQKIISSGLKYIKKD